MALQRRKVLFKNKEGLELAGLMEFPSGRPQGVALFAHCFTCGKDSAAASRISRALAARNMAVLRFDFTGLGGSDGDFANTNFSSNVDDLVAAADYLRQSYQAPVLLIGHSLGGAAVLAAAESIPESKAVVTIGAPASPAHVLQQFGGDIERIRTEGVAEVSLAGRPFTIRRQFLEDMDNHRLEQQISRLRKALLVFHAPLDRTVSIAEAGRIFQAAKHPKSFISLDQADHLLSNKADAEYVGHTIAAWISRYLELPDQEQLERAALAGGEVLVRERNHRFLREILSDDHFWLADEPVKVGGSNLGPDPYELLLASLGACTSMTVRMYANQKQWPLADVEVQLSHRRVHEQDCEACEDKNSMIDVMTRRVRLSGDLTEEQRQRLLEIANKCPVHKTLNNFIQIETWLES